MHPTLFGPAVGASSFRFPTFARNPLFILSVAWCSIFAPLSTAAATSFPGDAIAHATSVADETARMHGVPAEAWVSAPRAPMPASGGPDAFGYEFIDSDSPGGPSFQWFDISGLGTPLNLTDDGFANVSLPFGFSFYGATKNSVTISNNGYLTFGSDGADRNNDDIPDPNSPNDIIAPFWDNLQSTGGNVYHYYDSANGRFIVQYHNVTGHGDPDTHTFQVILQTNGQILFQYLTLGETLDRCTIGIENASGSTGLQVVANDDYLHNNLAIRFATPNAVPTVTSVTPNAGNRLQALDVVLTGTGFAAGVTSANFGAGITVNTTTINSATQLTANITIDAAAATGARNVQVINAPPGGGTATLTNGFTVNNPIPTLATATPNTAALGQTLNVVLTGTNFISGVSVASFGADITVNTNTVNSATQITANITIGAAATTGPRNIIVVNSTPGGGTATLVNGFAINNNVPTVTSATPNSGTRTQTLNVILAGTNFVNGVTTADFGAEVTVNSVVANSATQLTANLTIGAAAALGARNVVVTNPPPGGGSATLTSGFTINNPSPTLTSIAPTIATREQTLDIVLTGTGFLSGVSTVSFGADITVNTTTVNSATQITANVTVGPSTALGARDVSVTNPAPGGGTATLPASLTINNPTPTLTSIAPAVANQGQTLNVVFTGTGFLNGASTVDFGADVTINSTTVNSGTQITANLTVGAAAALGARNVSVSNPAPGGGTATLTNGFSIGLAAPTLTSIAPTSGERLATLNVNFTGTNFVNGATTVAFGADISVNSVTVNSATSITANITIASNAVLGLRDVSVTNPAPGGGTATLTNGFTVLNPSPTLTSLVPTSGNRGATLDVVLTGTNYVAGTTVNFGSNITVNSTTINSATQLTANISIATNAATGARDVIVTNSAPGGGSATLTSGFTVTNPLPTFTSLNPSSALQGQTLNVVLTGTNFISGVTTVDFGGDVTINTTTVNSSTQITANIAVSANATVGSRNVSVSNPIPGGGTATLAGSFTINYNSPTLTNVTPNNGNRVQTLDVVLTGSNFITGVTTADFGADIAINSITVNSATSLTANITIAQAAVTGLRNVSVTNPAPGGGTATLNNGFAVNNPTPALSVVNPNVGSRSETMEVVLTGENFLQNITTVSFGAGITVNAITLNSATELSANITIASNAALGFRNVAVTNPAPGGGTATFVNAFTVVNPTPTFTSIAPTLGLQNQTLNVVLTGTGFLNGITSVNFGADITINSTTVNSLTQITTNITIGANAAVGARAVSVTNVAPGGGTATLTGGFTIGYNAPTLTNLAPINANRLQTLDVVFTGTNFINGVTTVDFGADITINSVTVSASTQLTANIFIAGNATLGVRNVSVTNPDPAGGTAILPNSFTIGNPAPLFTSLAPTVAEREQTRDIVLTGDNFVNGLTTVNFGAGITVNTTTINSATQLTANVTIASNAATGARTVSVTNAAPGGGTASFVNGFNVNNAAPTLTNVAPASVSRGQTLDVVLTGSHFYTDASSVNLGADITINTTTINSLTQITANITVGVNAALGARNVSVTNAAPGGGTATLTNGLSVEFPTLAITNVAPNSGNRLQTLDVVVTGSNFLAGATTVSFGNDIAVNSTTVNSATQLTANLTLAAIAALGVRDVVVTNPAPGGGSATLTNGFTVNNPAPTITSATPNAGNRLQTLDVVLTGDNFIDGVTSVSFGNDVTINSVAINNATELTANLTIGVNAALGARNVVVTNAAPNGGSTTLTNGFTINNPAPILASVNPTLGLQGQTLNVILTGDNFISGVSSVSFGNDVTINSTTVNSATQITANVAIAANATLGARDASVTNAGPNGGVATLASGFTIGLPTLTLTSINPVIGNRLQTLEVVMTGTNFVAGATTASFGPGITVNSVAVNSATELTANITINGAAATGPRAVSVTNPDPGGSTATLNNSFIVNNPTPQVTSITPNLAGRGETLDIAITGDNFITGLTTASFGADISTNTITVLSATQMTVNVTIAANAAVGARTVVVTNPAPGGGSVTFINGFTVANPNPTLTNLAPTSGLQGQTLEVILTGSGFIAGLSSVSFGNEITVNSTTVNSGVQITANLTIAANATVGTREVSVTNPAPGGGTATLNAAFTIGYNAPTLTSLAPSIGGRLQTMNVVLTGSNFIDGVTTADFGTDVTINSVTANSATQLTANITIGPSAALGSRNVSVTNPPQGGAGGTATLPSSFTIINPAPAFSTVSPNNGAREATLDVVITGENFISGLTSVSFGNDITINTTTINSATQLTANLTIGAAATLGLRNVAVTNPAPGGGTATLVNAFNVSTILPTITSATPNAGNRLQTLEVVLAGGNFIAGVTSVSFGNDIAVNATTINSSTQLTANITISANAALGLRDIVVTNSGLGGGSATLTNGFTVNNPAPVLTSVNPTLGLQGQTLNVVLTGDNFIDGISSVSFGNDVTINTITVNSATQITTNLTIAANATSGGRDVSVTNAAPNGGTATLTSGFTIGFSTITLTSINPVVSNRLQTLDVVMSGSNFVTGMTTASFGPDITVNSVAVNSATQLTANITITANAATGARNVSVTNPDPGGSTATLNNSFIVNNPTPQLTAIAPNAGGRGETLDITMSGDNFITNVTTASFGAGVTVNAITVLAPNEMTVNITIAPNATLGARTVVVTNPAPGGGSVTFINGFTIANPAPTLTSIAPTAGLQGQTLNIVLNGTGFIDGLSVISFGNEVTVNSTTIISNTQASVNLTIAANATVGTRDVTVTNPAPGGGATTLAAAFTIGFNAPTLTSIAPSVGARLQTLNVVLSGSNFVNGVTTVDFGADVTTNSVIANSATQLTANITIAPQSGVGTREVSVTNPTPAGGTATLPNSFTITNPAPALTSVAPNSGVRETTFDVVVTGNSFIDGVTSVSFGNGITINTTTINSATELVANITITPSAATGLRNVVVTNAAPGGGAATLVNNFTVLNAAPLLTSIAPTFVSRGQTVDLVFTGAHFYQDATTANLGNDITINSITANALNQLTVNITVAANAALDARDVSVTNATPGGGTATLTGALTIGFPTITLTNATPNIGNRLQTLDIVLTGSNFIQGSTSVSFGNDISINSTTVNSSTQLTANITIAANAVLGARDVTVTNPPPGGGSATLTNGFTVNNPAPVLASVNPTSGSRLQTLDVILTGENFIDGVTSVNFGNEVTTNTTTINSATQLTANITIAVNATLGARDVIVTNVQGGSAVLTDGFTINNPAPVLTSITPTLGLQGQTLNVILTGGNFISGVSSVSFGNDVTINSTVVNSATQITVNVSIAANAALGAREVIVTNVAPGGGTATLTAGFTVGFNAPTLTQVNPPLGARFQTLEVTLTGSNFIAGVTSVNFGAGITINSTLVNSASQITANITISAAATTGARSVSVTNPDPGGATATLNNAFTVTNPTPALTNVTPNNGSRGQTLDVLLDGENFIAGGTTISFGSGITVNAITVNTPEQMSVNISIADNAALGSRNLVLSNPAPGGGSVTFINGFTIANPAPVLTSIAPTSGLQGQTLNVVLNGDGFIAGITTLSLGNDIAVNSLTVISTTQISANLSIAANAIIGPREVTITNAAPGGGTTTLAGAFTVGFNTPTLTSLAPNVGTRLQTLNVVFTGTHFIDGVTTVDFGNDIAVNSVSVNSGTQLTANITIAVNAVTGARNVSVTNPTPGGPLLGTTLTNGFIVNNPVPVIAGVSPNAGNRQQTLDVLVNGNNFIDGVTSVSFGNDITINTTNINSATQLTANITIGLNAAVGPRNVLVTNLTPGGGTATFSNGFTVGVSSPVLTSLAPQSGTRFQTMDVVLNGSNFMSNVTTVSFGNDIVVNSVSVTSLTQLTANITINPNAVLGARDVTVTNPPPDGGASTLAGAFTVVNPAPQLTSVAPVLGSLGQTLQVVLSGNNFLSGVTTANFGPANSSDITINSTTVNSSGQMTVDITIAANAVTGPRSVSVTNSAPQGGTATLNDVFTVGTPAPTLTSIIPNTGNRLQTLEVTLFGTNFINGQTTVSFGNNINVNSITFTSSTQVTANLTIAVNAALGARNVTVSNPGPLGGTATLENGFTVGVAIPTLTSISPTFGNRGQTLNVVMLGSNFTGGVTTADFGANITVNSVTVNSATQLTANITLAANAALGVRDVSVANPNPGGGTATLTNAFTVGIAIPTLASITPAQALRGQTLDLILNGSNFIVGSTTIDLGNDVTFNAINFNSTTQISANVTIGNGAAVGPRDVSVTNPGPNGGTATLTNGFTINVNGPTLTSISPTSGNRGQTLEVIFNGTNFSAGVTTVSMGNDVTVNAVAVNSTTQLTANLTIAANAALGTRDVSVTNVGPGGGTATLPSAFTVGIAIPTLTSVTPSSGNRSQTLNVVMVGSNFSAGTTTVNFGGDITINNVNVNSATQLTASISIGANAALGVREVSVTNTAPGGGTATLLNAFTVGGAVPTLLSLNPTGANRGQTLNVVLTGTNFANGLTTINFGNEVTINSVAFNNGTQMTANITIGVNAVLGARNVSVTNPPPGGGTATLPNAFTIGSAIPTLTSVNPQSANRGQTLDVKLIGSNFVNGVSSVSFGNEITVNSVTVISVTEINANITIAANATLGSREVSVTNAGQGGGTVTLANAFTVGAAIPTLTSVAPATGNRTQTLDVVFTGSNFIAGITSVSLGNEVTINSVVINSATQLTSNITIGANATLGSREASVTNSPAGGGGGTATLQNAFTIGHAQPVLTSVNPLFANRNQTLDVVLTGNNFAGGFSTVNFGSGITVNSVNVTGLTQMTVNITIGGSAVLGARDVAVTNPTPGGGTAILPNAFTVGVSIPTLTSLTPQSGIRNQTLDVTMTGTNFVSGVTSVSFGFDVTVNTVNVASATQLTANISIAPNAVLGNRDVSVTNAAPGGGTSTLPNAFNVGIGAPTLTNISPTSGNRGQTEELILTGSNFAAGLTTLSLGNDITINAIVVNSSTQLTASITIAVNAVLGARNVSVTNPAPGGGTATLEGAFTVGVAIPTLTNLSPAFGNLGQTLEVTLTGSNFAANLTTVNFGEGITINALNVISFSQMIANITIAANANVGARDVSATNPSAGGGTVTLRNAFTVGVAQPTLTSLAPNVGTRGQTLDVTLTGTNFVANVTKVNFGPDGSGDITVNTTTVTSGTQINVNITIAANAAFGSREVRVTNSGAGGGTATLPNAFSVIGLAPTLVSINPVSGNRGQTLEVQMLGSNFFAGISSVSFGEGLTVNFINVISATQITANIFITQNAALGVRDVSVTNSGPNGGTANLPNAFTVNTTQLALTSITPQSGNRNQTLDVIFTGANFVSGVTTASLGNDITVNGVTFNSSTQLTVNVSIGANAAFGSRDVSVSNPGQSGSTATLAGAFSVIGQGPSLTSINPISGNRGQTLDVQLTGANFAAGVSTVSFGEGIAINFINVISATQITANIFINQNAALGNRNVSVTNSGPNGGTANLPNAFTVNTTQLALTSITPTSGNRNQTLDVIFTGANFVSGVTTASLGNDITVNGVTFNSSTQLTVNVSIGANATLGSRDASVTNGGQGSATLPNAFTVGISLPGLSSVSPTGANRGQTLDVIFTGSNFTSGLTSVSLGNDITINATTVNSSTQLMANITIGANAALGLRNVSVTNSGQGGGTATLPNAFNVGTSIPLVTSITPSNAQRGQTLDVIVAGSNFILNATTLSLGNEVTINTLVINSATQLTANITVGPSAALGSRDVSVTNPPPGGGTGTLVNGFTVGGVPPTLTNIAPASGNRLQTLDVVLTGTNFLGGLTSVNFGSDITINNTTVNTATQLTVNLTISASATTGPRDVSVSNSGPGNGSAVLPNSFTVTTGAPTLAAIAPSSGKRNETLNVVLTGTNFFSGISRVDFGPASGGGITVMAITVQSQAQLTATIKIDSLAVLGLRNVSVTNAAPGGGVAVLNNAFTVRAQGAAKFLISGFIRTAEGAGISGVVLEGLPDNPITDATGFYQGSVNPGFSDDVRPVKGGFTFAPASRSYNNVQADMLAQDYTAILEQKSFAYPAPFNPSLEVVQIRFVFKNATEATLKIMDAAGDVVHEVENPGGVGRSGEIIVSWDGRNGRGEMVANGIYFYVITTSSQERITGKIAVLR